MLWVVKWYDRWWLESRFLKFYAGDIHLSHSCHTTTSTLTYWCIAFLEFVLWVTSETWQEILCQLWANLAYILVVVEKEIFFPLTLYAQEKVLFTFSLKAQRKITLILFLKLCELSRDAWPKTGRKKIMPPFNILWTF